ncbi:hypothetical protein ACIBQ1_52705 [Nonomuraea sp. NPDC050153]|uniref:hypothetical protein n=1 Tax=Nonomuraea sp. NPDC050153 TaxID=3364359 RepID=UPI0037BD76E3
MSLRKKLSAVLAACTVTIPLSAVVAQPAYATGGTCGSGYNFLSSYPLRGYGSHYDTIGGYLSIYYNPSNGYNCAITRVKAAWDGKASYVYVFLGDGDSRSVRDPKLDSSANYHYYAGPVKLYLKDQCVYADGSLKYDGETYNTRDAAYGVHCG